MGKKTGISWTDHTFNPWWGCVKVSEGCTHCYAETFAKRYGFGVFGVQQPRRYFGNTHWAEPLAWNREAEKNGVMHRVFCGSMCDVFENLPELNENRGRLWELIQATPHLQWLLLTKRPENLVEILPKEWFYYLSAPENVRIGTTIENQKVAYKRIRDLQNWPWENFISVEPMLESVSLAVELKPDEEDLDWAYDQEYGEEWQGTAQELIWRTWIAQLHMMPRMINWVIIGGESGAGCRPMNIEWATDLVEECKQANVPVFVKQMGGHPDKRDQMEKWPAELQVREYPRDELKNEL